ncbi:competence/damage-inducible protein A [Nisaea acidiphila]|uniref:Competence/damage-inducible protein A n=1 Tax=Nisaea acidiphila TaxID=1862145 RepID=A0A9J7AQ27_9PROT|nr:competence/damage-inducible protein A [Nisaea acidiphila]UUX49715.1 competence/damage-inducible protein A [Nisaea acidiphila]
MSDETVTSAFLIIGNEILSGRTKDKNLGFLAEKLTEAGIRLSEVRVVRDEEGEIVDALRALSERYTYVFTSGGIGPTHDDITCASVAAAFGLPVIRHPEAMRRLTVHYATIGREFNEARKKMAETPEGATLIDNPVSTAPGFIVENVHVMAGVPSVFQAMVLELLPKLKHGTKVQSRAVSCTLGEGVVAEALGEIQGRYPAIEIGSYPYFRAGYFGTTLVARGTDIPVLEEVADEIRRMIREKGGEPIEARPEEEGKEANAG